MDSVRFGASQTVAAAAVHPACACGAPDGTEFLQELGATLASARAQGRPFAVLAVAAQPLAASDIAASDLAACTLPSPAAQLDWILGARLASACGADEVPGFLGPGHWALRLALGEPAAPGADTAPTQPLSHTSAQAQTQAASLHPQALAVLAALQAPVWLCGQWMQAAVGLGLAVFPGDGTEPVTLLQAALAAAAGAAAQGGIKFHSAADNAPLLRQWHLGQALQQAQARQELRLLYQPKLSLESGQIVGVQARLHWHSAEHGVVPAAEFMPLAERLGLMPELGAWCLRQACQQVLAWQQAGLRRLRVSVNISPLQWQQAHLAQQVQRVLIDTGVDPASLAIELSEDSLMADQARSRQTLRELKALGVEIALKNFGTGASSLGALQALPVDVLNVDQSFVHDVTASAASVSVTRAIITLAHGMRLRVLAEGVLTESQVGLLAAKGCDLIQGDWFSPPLPPEQISTLLQEAVVLPARFLRRREHLRTLLLVDDEDNILSALKRLLRRDGYRILTASGGEEALRCLAENSVDVILSDQRMPGMSGVEFLRRAKALHPGTVRMTLSGFTELQSIIDAVNEGAIYKFLTKPWDDTLLRQHVAEAFRQKELDDENKRLSMEVAHANAELEAASARLASLLQAQREQTALVAASASGAHEMLDELPVAVLGIDPDGVMAYANRAAAGLLPQAHAALGCLAEDVFPALLGRELPAAGPPVALHLGGRSYRAVTQHLEPTTAAPLGRGRLVLLIDGAEAA